MSLWSFMSFWSFFFPLSNDLNKLQIEVQVEACHRGVGVERHGRFADVDDHHHGLVAVGKADPVGASGYADSVLFHLNGFANHDKIYEFRHRDS